MSKHILDIDGFEKYLILRGGRSITIARHIRWIKDRFSLINDFTFDKVKQCLDNKKLGGTSNMTLRNVVTTIKLYARSQKINDDKLCHFPLDGYSRVNGIIRRTLPDDVIEKLLNTPRRPWMSEERHKLFTVFWSIISFTALKPGENVRDYKNHDI